MAQQKEKSVELLNKGVALELQSILQYLYFYFHAEDVEYDHLAKLFKTISIREMEHLERLSERILFLNGDVSLNIAHPLSYMGAGNFDVEKALAIAYQMESDTIDSYNQWASEAGALHDSATKRLFEELVQIEEEHEDTFDVEAQDLKKFGIDYLALQNVRHGKKKYDEYTSTGFKEDKD